MGTRTRGEIKQQVIDRLGIEITNEPRTVRVIESAIDGSEQKLCSMFEWTWLEDILQLPVDGTATRFLLPDGSTVVGNIENTDGTITTGAILPYVRNVVHAEVVSTGRTLYHRDRIVDALFSDALAAQTRNVPQFWGTFGRYFYTMPLPYEADAIRLFVVKGAAPMINDAQEPLCPADFRQWYVEEVLATTYSSDSFDVRKQARARDNAMQLLSGLVQFSAAAKPRYKTIEVLPFQT